MRLATGAASGAAAAIQGIRATRTPDTPQVLMVETPPTRPRALEEYDMSEAGCQEVSTAAAAAIESKVMARVRELERQLAHVKEENDRLKQ